MLLPQKPKKPMQSSICQRGKANSEANAVFNLAGHSLHLVCSSFCALSPQEDHAVFNLARERQSKSTSRLRRFQISQKMTTASYDTHKTQQIRRSGCGTGTADRSIGPMSIGSGIDCGMGPMKRTDLFSLGGHRGQADKAGTILIKR